MGVRRADEGLVDPPPMIGLPNDGVDHGAGVRVVDAPGEAGAFAGHVPRIVIVIAYCTIGNRASEAWFALTHLLDYPDTRV